MRVWLGFSLVLGALLLPLTAVAQDPARPPTPAAGEAPPPPAYPPPADYPPPGGYPPPAYNQPPPGYHQPPPPPPNYGAPEPGPREMDYEEGDAVPPGYRLETKMRKGLVIAGAATFGGVYLITVVVASIADSVVRENQQEVDCEEGWLVDSCDYVDKPEDDDDFVPLFVPVIGPFITIGTAEASPGGAIPLVLSGLGQSAGVAMFIAGLVAKQTYLRRVDGKAEPTLQLAPLLGSRHQGVALTGSF